MFTAGGKNLNQALDLAEARLISICGSGGKTTMMFTLAQEFADAGERVLITTTTKIAKEEAENSWPSIHASDANTIIEQSRPHFSDHGGGAVIATSGQAQDPIKLEGFPSEEIDRLKEDGFFDRILVEADGSRRLPLKAPAPYEPAVPNQTDAHIVVAGLNGLGESLSEETLFRPNIWAQLTGSKIGEPITPESLAAVIAHKDGLAKGCPPNARNILFLNRSGSMQSLFDAKKIIKILSETSGRKPDLAVAGWLLPEVGISEIFNFN